MIILEEIVQVAKQQNKELAALTDDLPLVDSGLDSLCMAVLVAVLDDRLGLDPFERDEQMSFPVTLGDLISLYEHAAT
jgi:acyl carrier protein